MKPAKNLLLFVVAVILLSILIIFIKNAGKQNSDVNLRPASSSDAGPSPVPSDLLQKHCASCHVLPPPDILTKRSWTVTLAFMGMRLGITDIEYLRELNGDMVPYQSMVFRRKAQRDAHLIPSPPTITQVEWEAIRSYYLQNAPEEPDRIENKQSVSDELTYFKKQESDYRPPQTILTSLVKINERDQIVYLGDSMMKALSTMNSKGVTLSVNHLGIMPVDIDIRDQSLYVMSIGDFIAARPGKKPASIVEIEENPGKMTAKRKILENLYRACCSKYGDLNQDGLEDVVTCGFGDTVGSFSWHEQRTDGTYEEHVLFDRPGAVQAEIFDFDRDELPDIAVLMADGREGLYIFINQGEGAFEARTIWEKHPSFGHTYMEVRDLNEDGLMDFLIVNGDNVDASPYTEVKDYHGIRIYTQTQDLEFEETYFYPMYGAFVARSADFDQDGDVDIAAISFYPDYSLDQPENFVLLQNESKNRKNFEFKPFTHPASYRGRWLTMDAGDMDGDGDIDIVLGAGYPLIGMVYHRQKFDDLVRNGQPVLVLKNTIRD